MAKTSVTTKEIPLAVSGGVSYILHGLTANNVTKSVSAIRDNTSKNVTKSEPFQNNSQIDKDMRLEQLHELTEEDVLKEEQDKKHQEEEQQTKSLQEVQQQKEQLQIAEKKQSLEEKDEKNPAQEEEEQEQKEELHNEQNQKEAEQKTNGAIELAQQPQTCKLKYNIALLKMHKCSSSTVQNILLRFSEKHDLTVIMPPRGNYLGYPSPFNKKFMIQVPWNEYNIYTYHSRFSYKGISEVMPKDTVYMTVLRDPVPMYESSFTYFRIGGRYGLKGSNALEQFLMNPDGYFKSNSNKGRVKNPMLYDLGFDPENMYSMDKIDKKIQEIDSIFKIVLISEYFEESLILLKEIMCWDMEDIVVLQTELTECKLCT
uniref:Galactosylceramide sulfotransferase-like n=1 Tax=Saccoglossus kowalevskii TaxID=10224 RepID=A0ABM0MFW0_SACKO|nr:PREDICTED: galactosylceramide sulfotransferase-like [Saccoglossus kowalevskii]